MELTEGIIEKNYCHNRSPTPRQCHKQSPQHILPTVNPTGAGRRLIPSFVRERVGLRSGGISLRSLAQAKPATISPIPQAAPLLPSGHSDRSRPTYFPLVRPRTSRPAQRRNLSSIPRASQAKPTRNIAAPLSALIATEHHHLPLHYTAMQ